MTGWNLCSDMWSSALSEMVYVTLIRERFPEYNIHSSHDSFPRETNGFSVSPFICIIT